MIVDYTRSLLFGVRTHFNGLAQSINFTIVSVELIKLNSLRSININKVKYCDYLVMCKSAI